MHSIVTYPWDHGQFVDIGFRLDEMTFQIKMALVCLISIFFIARSDMCIKLKQNSRYTAEEVLPQSRALAFYRKLTKQRLECEWMSYERS